MEKGDISTELRRIIQERNWHGSVDIEKIVDELLSRVDLSHLTEEDLKRSYLRQIASVLLNYYGYSSVKYGKEIWFNPELLTTDVAKREAFAKLLNRKMDAKDAAILLVEKVKDKAKPYKGQLSFDFEEERFVVDMDDDEFLRILRQMAE